MKKLRRLLDSRKNLAATSAQLTALFIILPGLFYVLGLLLPEEALVSWLKSARTVPGFDGFYGYFCELTRLNPGGIKLIPHFLQLFRIMEAEVLKNTIFSTGILAMCLYAAKLLGNKLLLRGIPILQTLIGTILGIVLICFAKLYSAAPSGIAVLIVLIILNIVLTFTLESGQKVKKILSLTIGMGLSLYTAAAALAYICVLLMIGVGAMPTFLTALFLFCTTAIPFLILVTVDYYLLMPKR